MQESFSPPPPENGYDAIKYEAMVAVLNAHQLKLKPEEFQKMVMAAFQAYSLATRRQLFGHVLVLLEGGQFDEQKNIETLDKLGDALKHATGQLLYLMQLALETHHPDQPTH